MKRTIEKRFSRTILAASIAAIGFCAAPLARAESPAGEIQPSPVNAAEGDSGKTRRPTTQPKSEIEAGIGKTSSDSYKFGDYRGLENSEAHVIANINMRSRSDDNARYLEIIGRNLGLSGVRDFRIAGGEQGNYRLSFEYGELTKLHSDTYQTPYTGMGSPVLTAPPGWAGTIDSNLTTAGIQAPGATTNVATNMMTALAANMKRFNVETRRKAAELGLTRQLDGGWDIAANYKREKKDGTKLTGAPFQTVNATDSRGTLLAPEPINYTTDLFDVLAHYAGENLQMQVGYHVSLFNNANRSLVFDNLYYNAASTGGGNALTGRLGQMPDNQFHQIDAAGGYAISGETRLSGNLSLGRMTQNEAFLPYDTTLNAMPATASLNGKIDTAHADIKLNSKLARALNFTAGYRYDDDRDNTPVNTYTYVTAENTVSAASNLNNTRQNTPLSKKQQSVYAEMNYALSAATKLKLGYDYSKTTHTYLPATDDHEQTAKAEVKHSFGDTASAGLAYARSDRKASAYNVAEALAATYTSAYLASRCVTGNSFLYRGVVTACTGTATATFTATAPFLDTPALRKFFLTDRKRDKLHAFANIAPGEKLDLQFGASYYNEKYPDTEAGFGLTRATGWTANFDANLAATETVSGIFFATFEDYRTDQNSHQVASGTYTLDRQNNTAAFDAFTGVISRIDRSLTAGLGFRVKPDDSYEWGGDLTHATTVGSTGFSNLGSSIAAAILPMPDAVSRLNRLELFGKYRVQKDVLLNMRYAHEKYTSTDWAWDGQQFASSRNFIGTGQTSPDYSINMINVTLNYMF